MMRCLILKKHRCSKAKRSGLSGWVQIVPLLSIQTEGGPQKMRCANREGLSENAGVAKEERHPQTRYKLHILRHARFLSIEFVLFCLTLKFGSK